MDLEAGRLRQASSLHWTKVSATVCFLFAGAVLAYSLIPAPLTPPLLQTGEQTVPARH